MIFFWVRGSLTWNVFMKCNIEHYISYCPEYYMMWYNVLKINIIMCIKYLSKEWTGYWQAKIYISIHWRKCSCLLFSIVSGIATFTCDIFTATTFRDDTIIFVCGHFGQELPWNMLLCDFRGDIQPVKYYRYIHCLCYIHT